MHLNILKVLDGRNTKNSEEFAYTKFLKLSVSSPLRYNFSETKNNMVTSNLDCDC